MILVGQSRAFKPIRVCTLFCEQLFFYSTMSVISMNSSSLLLPVSSSMDWSMLSCLSLLLFRILSCV